MSKPTTECGTGDHATLLEEVERVAILMADDPEALPGIRAVEELWKAWRGLSVDVANQVLAAREILVLAFDNEHQLPQSDRYRQVLAEAFGTAQTAARKGVARRRASSIHKPTGPTPTTTQVTSSSKKKKAGGGK